jgi:hypothetical protein
MRRGKSRDENTEEFIDDCRTHFFTANNRAIELEVQDNNEQYKYTINIYIMVPTVISACFKSSFNVNRTCATVC